MERAVNSAAQSADRCDPRWMVKSDEPLRITLRSQSEASAPGPTTPSIRV